MSHEKTVTYTATQPGSTYRYYTSDSAANPPNALWCSVTFPATGSDGSSDTFSQDVAVSGAAKLLPIEAANSAVWTDAIAVWSAS